MNREELKTKIYRKREWGINLPLHKNLKELETQVQDLSKFIIEDILKVDEEADKKLTYFKENDFEEFKTEITIDGEGIKTEVKKLREETEKGISSNTSLINQTATDIRLEVDNTETTLDGKITANTSLINQTATDIRLEVDNTETTLDGKITANTSLINQTATDIRLEVKTSDTALDGKITANTSLINQTATDIRLEVTNTETELDGKITANTSLINQTATDIDLKITDGDYLMSQINLGTDGVVIKGDKIKINDNFIVDKEGNLSIKQISANLLSAGVIDADEIVVRNLKADSITTGSIITDKIADASITTDKISVTGLDAKVISAGIIDANKVSIINLSAENITVGKINGTQITEGSITGTQISNGTITTEKIISTGISANVIKTGTLSVGESLSISGVINGNLAEFTNIKARNITVGTINGNQISDNTLGDNHILDLSANKLTAGTIDANLITVNNLHAENITVGTINGNQISDNTLGDNHILDLSANKLTAGTINANLITVTNLNATNINSGVLNANRLSVGTEFVVDSTGKLTINEMSANKISTGTIDANDITVSNLNAENITVGKINGSQIGDSQLGSNHFKELTADKITGGTISSSTFTTSSEEETTTITGGTITYLRNGSPITTFRNMRSGVIATNSTGTGVVTFTGMKSNLSILTSIKSFNISQNIRSLHCYAELVDLALNKWKFIIGGTESSSTGHNEIIRSFSFSKNCYNLSLSNIKLNLDNSVVASTNRSTSYFENDYITINIRINVKITYNDGLGNSRIIYNNNIVPGTRITNDSPRTETCSGANHSFPVDHYIRNIHLNLLEIGVNQTFSTFNTSTKSINVQVSYVNNSITAKNYNCQWDSMQYLSANKNYNRIEMPISYSTEQKVNLTGSGEVQYTAYEQ